MDFRTADLCDQFSDELEVCEPLFKAYGGQVRFAGPLATIKCFEDNSRVRDLVAERGNGRVLVVDAGGSMRRAVLGDLLAHELKITRMCRRRKRHTRATGSSLAT